MAQTIDYVIHKIRDYRKVKGYAKFKLATLADVPEGCLRDLDEPKWNPTLFTIRKIEAVIPEDFTPKPINAKTNPPTPKKLTSNKIKD